AHDRVVRPQKRKKELHFFNRFWSGEVPGDIAERYAELFPRPEGSITGEWTPRYMHDFWSLRLLREAAPETKVLVLLRDPVERWRSGTSRAVRLAEEAGEPIRLVQFSDAVWRGFYFEQLRRLFDLFPRERVLVLQFEHCRDEPLEQMARTCEFLGVEPFAELPRNMTREREPKPKPKLSAPMREELVALLADDVRRTAELCSEIDLARWPNFRE
nr:sulfotransferase [Actinomycetota bacterium]